MKKIKQFLTRLSVGLAFIFRSSGTDYMVLYQTKDDRTNHDVTCEYDENMDNKLVLKMLACVMEDKELFPGIELEYD